jgi:type VI protein secretion system component Hcp
MADESIVLSYEGVPGEIASLPGVGAAPPGDGWIWASHCSFRTEAAYAQSDTARRTMQAEIKVSFATEVNRATTGLLRAALAGTFDKSVVIAFLRTTSDGAREEYLRLELENCGIAAFKLAGGAERPKLYFDLHCGAFTIMSWDVDASTRGAPARVTVLNEV